MKPNWSRKELSQRFVHGTLEEVTLFQAINQAQRIYGAKLSGHEVQLEFLRHKFHDHLENFDDELIRTMLCDLGVMAAPLESTDKRALFDETAAQLERTLGPIRGTKRDLLALRGKFPDGLGDWSDLKVLQELMKVNLVEKKQILQKLFEFAALHITEEEIEGDLERIQACRDFLKVDEGLKSLDDREVLEQLDLCIAIEQTFEPSRSRVDSPGAWRNRLPKQAGNFYKTEKALTQAARRQAAREKEKARQKERLERWKAEKKQTEPDEEAAKEQESRAAKQRTSRRARGQSGVTTSAGLKLIAGFDHTEWTKVGREKLDMYDPNPREMTADADYIDEFLYGHMLHHPRLQDWVEERAPEDVDLPAPCPPTFQEMGYATSLDLKRRPKYYEEFMRKKLEQIGAFRRQKEEEGQLARAQKPSKNHGDIDEPEGAGSQFIDGIEWDDDVEDKVPEFDPQLGLRYASPDVSSSAADTTSISTASRGGHYHADLHGHMGHMGPRPTGKRHHAEADAALNAAQERIKGEFQQHFHVQLAPVSEVDMVSATADQADAEMKKRATTSTRKLSVPASSTTSRLSSAVGGGAPGSSVAKQFMATRADSPSAPFIPTEEEVDASALLQSLLKAPADLIASQASAGSTSGGAKALTPSRMANQLAAYAKRPEGEALPPAGPEGTTLREKSRTTAAQFWDLSVPEEQVQPETTGDLLWRSVASMAEVARTGSMSAVVSTPAGADTGTTAGASKEKKRKSKSPVSRTSKTSASAPRVSAAAATSSSDDRTYGVQQVAAASSSAVMESATEEIGSKMTSAPELVMRQAATEDSSGQSDAAPAGRDPVGLPATRLSAAVLSKAAPSSSRVAATASSSSTKESSQQLQLSRGAARVSAAAAAPPPVTVPDSVASQSPVGDGAPGAAVDEPILLPQVEGQEPKEELPSEVGSPAPPESPPPPTPQDQAPPRPDDAVVSATAPATDDAVASPLPSAAGAATDTATVPEKKQDAPARPGEVQVAEAGAQDESADVADDANDAPPRPAEVADITPTAVLAAAESSEPPPQPDAPGQETPEIVQISWSSFTNKLPVDETHDAELVDLYQSLDISANGFIEITELMPPTKLLNLVMLSPDEVGKKELSVLPDVDEVFTKAFAYATEHSPDPGVKMDEDGFFHFLTYLLDFAQLRSIFVVTDEQQRSQAASYVLPPPRPGKPDRVYREHFVNNCIAPLRAWGMHNVVEEEAVDYWQDIAAGFVDADSVTFVQMVDWAARKAADEHDHEEL